MVYLFRKRLAFSNEKERNLRGKKIFFFLYLKLYLIQIQELNDKLVKRHLYLNCEDEFYFKKPTIKNLINLKFGIKINIYINININF